MSRSILLGVCGGIAAYKAASLASALVQRGDDVRVVMTEGARRFVAPLTFEALTRRAVLSSLWDAPETIPHIALVREAHVLVIAPATANVLAKIALGIADDLLTNMALAARIPIVVAPAMNDAMWLHEATQAHARTLEARGVRVVEPGVGFLAEREHGPGRLADLDAIVMAIDDALATGAAQSLAGERVLITAGPTREAIDPVRFLSNASTGTMGIELAREALARGAQVDLVLGPTDVAPPHGADLARVTSAQEMHDATLARAAHATIAIAAAAVADWRPALVHAQKVKKSDGSESLELERTPDILAALGARKNGTFLVGFAAETERFEEYAREKLARKHLDAIAVNDVSRADSGFGKGENELVLLWGSDGRAELGRGSKRIIARRMWDALGELRAARADVAAIGEPSCS
jgi:phosphopantothenoylcysteine decarboxylase/phosphopantothenate--cysteine ligase